MPSLLRGFSAPVKLNIALSDDQLAFLMAHDSDAFSRWEAGQMLSERLLKQLVEDDLAGRTLAVPESFIAAVGAVLKDHQADPAFKALMLSLPGEAELLECFDAADPKPFTACASSY